MGANASSVKRAGGPSMACMTRRQFVTIATGMATGLAAQALLPNMALAAAVRPSSVTVGTNSEFGYIGIMSNNYRYDASDHSIIYCVQPGLAGSNPGDVESRSTETFEALGLTHDTVENIRRVAYYGYNGPAYAKDIYSKYGVFLNASTLSPQHANTDDQAAYIVTHLMLSYLTRGTGTAINGAYWGSDSWSAACKDFIRKSILGVDESGNKVSNDYLLKAICALPAPSESSFVVYRLVGVGRIQEYLGWKYEPAGKARLQKYVSAPWAKPRQ